ncbi:MAG: leucine-rich repeat protein, partial [Oscillospiraceae bacterium]|nr:leucine-rich repeat protein [Oscillospiraceae bacterium]
GDTNGYTLYSGTSATVDRVTQAISNGGVVIFDSHGTTDYAYGDDYVTGATSSYLCLTTTSGLTTTDYQLGAMYSTSGESAVNGAVIANHMTKNSPGGILWMAICLGMATDGLYKPMRQKGVEVVYGYSQSVTFGGDYRFEEAFWDEMKEGYTVAESIATMKNTYGNWDYSYQIAVANGWSSYASTIASARYNYCAFPIVVSDQDTHPGQRTASQYASSGFFGADSLQTVKSTYKLFEGGSDDVNVFTWDVSDGVFTITGNGDMPNYSSASAYPWYEYRNSISSVVIGDGVTAVADYAFSGFPYIKQVDLGKTVKTVGIQSFYNCSSLQELYAPGTLTTIRTYGFTGCNNVQNVYFGGSSSSWSGLSYRPYPNWVHYNVSTMTGHWTPKTVQATCTTDGYTYETCGCGYEQNRVITQTALGHSYRQTVVDPTCTAGGYTNYTCTVCGYSYTGNAVAATGHSYQKTVMAPTCTANGYTHYNCTMCGYSYTDDVVAATGHNYQPTVFAPTCTASGFTRYSCTACGHHYTDDYLPATGHSYGATVVVKPTITNGGYSYIACTQCDFVYTFNHTSPLQMSAPTVSVSLSKTGKPVLSWQYELEAKFEIYRATSKNGTYSKLTTTDSTTIWDTTAVVGKTYYYKIRAVYAYDSSAVSPYSNVVSATAIAETPVVSISNNSSGKPYISWAKADGAKKYTVYRATTQNGKYSKLGTTTKLYYADTKAKSGNTYYYKVIANASSSKYNSAYSSVVYCSVICGTPTLSYKLDSSTAKPNLTWTKAEGVVKYAVYRMLPNQSYVLLTTLTSTKYNDTSAPADTTCKYYVQALGKTSAVNGKASNVITAVTGIPKPTISGGNNATSGKPVISWNAVGGAVKYEIYRSTKSTKGYTLL